VLRELERTRWDKERKDWANRVMSGNWGAYIAMNQTQAQLEEEKEKVAEPKVTAPYSDKAWFM
jgi:hypothetical protein